MLLLPTQHDTVNGIFSNARRRITIGLAIAFTAGLMVFYGLANWIPSILTAKGVALPVALQAAMIFNLSGLAGAIGVAAMVSRIGSRMGLLIVLCSAIATVAGLAYLLGRPNLAIMPVIVFVGLAGGLLAGLQVALYALAAWAYPTDCRATGVGFSAGIGRLGPIVSAFGGGVLLDLDGGVYWFFGAAVFAILFIIFGITLVDRHTPPAQ